MPMFQGIYVNVKRISQNFRVFQSIMERSVCERESVHANISAIE